MHCSDGEVFPEKHHKTRVGIILKKCAMKKFLFFSLLLVMFSCNKTVNEDLPKEKNGEAFSSEFETLYSSLKNDSNFLGLLSALRHRSALLVENVRVFEDKNYLDQLNEKISEGKELTEEEYLQILSLYGFQSEEDFIAQSNALQNTVDSLNNAYPTLGSLTQAQFQIIINNLFEESILVRSAPPCHIVCGECYDDVVWDCLADVGWNTISGVGTGIGFGSPGGFFGSAFGGILGGLGGYGYGIYKCYRSIRNCDNYVPPGCTQPCGEI